MGVKEQKITFGYVDKGIEGYWVGELSRKNWINDWS